MRNGQPSLPLILSLISAVVLSFLVVRMDLASYGMWSDQASYLSAALSLGHDGDLVWEHSDLLRFREQGFPEGPKGIILFPHSRSGEWYHSIAWLYPLIASPLVLIFGYHGMLLMNVVLFSTLTYFTLQTLTSRLGKGWGLVLAAILLIFSLPFFYVFIIMGELLNTVLLMAAGYMLLKDHGTSHAGRMKPFAVGVMVGFVSMDKPVHVILAAAFILLSARRWRRSGLLWSIAGSVLAVILYWGTNYAMIDEITIRGRTRQCFTSAFPSDSLTEQKGPRPHAGSSTTALNGANTISVGTSRTGSRDEGFLGRYRWARSIFRLPNADITLRNAAFLLLGRHTGILWYQTGAVVCLLLFFSAPSPGSRKIVAAAIFIDAYMWITLFPHHWSGAHSLGNRYFMPVLCLTPLLVPHRPNRIFASVSIAATFLFSFFTFSQMIPYPIRHNLYSEIHAGRLPFRWGRLEDTQLSQVAHMTLGNRVQVHGGSAYVFGSEPYTDTSRDVIVIGSQESFDLLYMCEDMPDSIPLCVMAGEHPLSFTIRHNGEELQSSLIGGSVADLCFHEPVACPGSPNLARREILFHVDVENEENNEDPESCFLWIGRQSRECFPSIIPLQFDMDISDPVGAAILGWELSELWGPGSVKWTANYRAISGFRIESIPEGLNLGIRLKTICPDQLVNVWFNGNRVGRWRLQASDGFVTNFALIDGSILRKAPRANILILESQNLCQSPRLKAQGTEGRSLGIACDWIHLDVNE